MNSYADTHDHMGGFAADAVLDQRMGFIRKTYTHVFAAILAFIGLELLYFSTPIGAKIVSVVGPNWLLVLIAFLVVSWLAERWAHSGVSVEKQYLGLGVFVLAESIIFVPLLAIAAQYSGNIIPTAGFLTLMIFGGLTLFVFVTKQDFSFLRGALVIGGMAALGIVLGATIFGWQLSNLAFVGAMILLLCGNILYDTSNVLHHYRTDQYVAASLALFGSIATLFWYMIRLLMILNRD